MSLLERLQKSQVEISISDALKEARDKTFDEFLKSLKENGNLEWFLKLKVSDVIQLKQIKHLVDEEVADEEDYKTKIIETLNEVNIKIHKRGISSAEIKEKIGGNGSTLRKVLSSLIKDKKIWSTGKTQGMKWVLYKDKDKAEIEHMRGNTGLVRGS